MKRTFIASILALLIAGCATTQDQKEAQQIALVNIVSREAAYTSANITMQKNPELKVKYQVASEMLRTILKGGNVDSTNLRQVLSNLPAVKGNLGYYVDSLTTLFIAGTGYVQLDNAPLIKAALEGLVTGFDNAIKIN